MHELKHVNLLLVLVLSNIIIVINYNTYCDQSAEFRFCLAWFYGISTEAIRKTIKIKIKIK